MSAEATSSAEAPTLAPFARSTAGSATELVTVPSRYVIERELGRGGMGVVYLARDLLLDRPCALKVVLSGDHSSDEEIQRFHTEAQAIARLQHPGIVQVFEVGEIKGKPFMALEFCAGGSLDAVLAKNPLAPEQAAKLVRILAEAMQAAHAANVIHRDLKPANVLLTDPGERPNIESRAARCHSPPVLIPKITDFGLARRLDESGTTRTGTVMGTPSYMPPEQAEGKKDIGPAADIYSLGAILYECLVGRPPFRAATALDTLLQVLTEEPVPLARLNSKIPPDLDAICRKCLSKDPARRYASAQALADDLGRFLAGEPVQADTSMALRVLDSWLSESRHTQTLALFGRVWLWQAGITFVLFATINVLIWLGRDDWLTHGLVLLLGLVALLLPGFYYLFDPQRTRTVVERQMDQVWSLFLATVVISASSGCLTGIPWQALLPILILELAFAVGCTGILLRGSLHLLSVLCLVSAVLVAAFPMFGPIAFGTAFAIGLAIPAWQYTRPGFSQR